MSEPRENLRWQRSRTGNFDGLMIQLLNVEPRCYNFVEFFLGRSCIKSCTRVVPFSLTNSPVFLFFGPQVPPGLLWIQRAGEYGSARVSQIDGKSPDQSIGIPDQFRCLRCCGRGKLHFFPIARHPWASPGRSPHQILPGRMPIRGNPVFLPIARLPIPPRRPFPSIISRRMHVRGKYIISSDHPTSHWPPRHSFPLMIPSRMPDQGKSSPWLFPLLGTNPSCL